MNEETSPPQPTDEFRRLHAQWVEYLSGSNKAIDAEHHDSESEQAVDPEHDHSLVTQIHRLTWWAATFRSVADVRIAAEVNGTAKFGVVDQLISDGAIAGISSGIRRLLDTGSMHGERGVHSIPALIRDIKENKKELTRRNLCWARGVALDPSKVKIAEDEYFKKHSNSGNCHIPRSVDHYICEEFHREFDRIGAGGGNRSPDDLVGDAVFQRLQARLQSAEPVAEFVNKFIAHASTKESRSSATKRYQIQVPEIWAALETVSRCVLAIDLLLRGHGHSLLAFWHGEEPLFAGLDQPLAESMDAANANWAKYHREADSWQSGTKEWLLGTD